MKAPMGTPSRQMRDRYLIRRNSWQFDDRLLSKPSQIEASVRAFEAVLSY